MKMLISQPVTVKVSDVATAHYEPSDEPQTVPSGHAERIEAAGAGRRVEVKPASRADEGKPDK